MPIPVQDGGQPQPWIQTPLVESEAMSKLAGCRIFLKLDHLQPSGSFKSRGIGNFILSHLRKNQNSAHPPHFYTSSGGNAGLACVAASKTLGHPCTVVVPMSCKPHMIDKLKLAGANDVIQHGATWFEADKHLREEVMTKDPGAVYVHPFDHPEVWNGHSTIVSEINEQLGDAPNVIICSVGGGGLFTGIAQRIEGGKTKLVAVETKGAESLHESIKAGKLVTLPGITSVATSLGAVTVAPQALEWGLKDNVESTVVSDEEACRACVKFAEEERALVEPACGATLALVYENKLVGLVKDLSPDTKVVLVVCGGRNVGLELIQQWKEQYL